MSFASDVFDKLLDVGGLLRVRAVLAILLTIGGIIMYAIGVDVPQEFAAMWLAVLMFYFGSRV